METFIALLALSVLVLILVLDSFKPKRDYRDWLNMKHPAIDKLYLAGFEMRTSFYELEYHEFYHETMNIGVIISKGGEKVYILRGRDSFVRVSLEELDNRFFYLILKEKL